MADLNPAKAFTYEMYDVAATPDILLQPIEHVRVSPLQQVEAAVGHLATISYHKTRLGLGRLVLAGSES
jgi:hypothetical protein